MFPEINKRISTCDKLGSAESSYWPTSYWPSSWLVGVGSEGRFQPRAALYGVCADLNSWEAQRERDLKTLLLLTNEHLRPGHAHSDTTYREVSARFACGRDTVTWSPGGQEWGCNFSLSCHINNIYSNILPVQLLGVKPQSKYNDNKTVKVAVCGNTDICVS